MVELTERARKGLDDYLRQVRAYLRWSKSLDRDEVEQNITEHIEREFEGTPEPVSCGALESVLARLGTPQQWVPPEALNWVGKIVLRLRTDSQDWRLAYISFAFLLAGCLLTFVVPLFFFVFVAASFITARAALAVAGDQDLSAQKWLLYPSLLIVSAALVVTVLVGPGVLAGLIGALLHEVAWVRRASNMGLVAFSITSAVLVGGLWWIALGLALHKWPELVRSSLHPFADQFNRRYALALFGVGLLLLLLFAGLIGLFAYGK